MTVNCPIMLDKSKSILLNHQSDDYLSNSNVIYLELIQPPKFINDYDDSYHQFKLFFTTFTPKLHIGLNKDLFICPAEHLIDCNDSYCVHTNARCNGINECRTKVDEQSCKDRISMARSISHVSYFIINVKYIFIVFIISML
jgi:hypothetical protein